MTTTTEIFVVFVFAFGASYVANTVLDVQSDTSFTVTRRVGDVASIYSIVASTVLLILCFLLFITVLGWYVYFTHGPIEVQDSGGHEEDAVPSAPTKRSRNRSQKYGKNSANSNPPTRISKRTSPAGDNNNNNNNNNNYNNNNNKSKQSPPPSPVKCRRSRDASAVPPPVAHNFNENDNNEGTCTSNNNGNSNSSNNNNNNKKNRGPSSKNAKMQTSSTTGGKAAVPLPEVPKSGVAAEPHPEVSKSGVTAAAAPLPEMLVSKGKAKAVAPLPDVIKSKGGAKAPLPVMLVSKGKAKAVAPLPDVIKSKAGAKAPLPDVIESKAKAIAPLPDVIKSKAGAKTPLPDVIKSKAKAVAPLPDVIKSKAKAVAPLPDVIKSKAMAVAPLPDVVKSKAAAKAPLPDVIKSKAKAVAPLPDVVKSKVAAKAPLPDVVKSKAAAAHVPIVTAKGIVTTSEIKPSSSDKVQQESLKPLDNSPTANTMVNCKSSDEEKKTAKTTTVVEVLDKRTEQAETVVLPGNVEPNSNNDENVKPKLSKSARRRANKRKRKQMEAEEALDKLCEKLKCRPRNLNADDRRSVWFLLSRHVLKRNDMFEDGFAFPSTVSGHAVCHRMLQHWKKLNPYAEEFNMETTPHTPNPCDQQLQKCDEKDNKDSAPCVRCTFYFQNKTQPGPCKYHHGKVNNPPCVDRKQDSNRPSLYSCCGKSLGTPGCTWAPCHVWDGIKIGTNGPLPDFKETYNKYVHNKVEIRSSYTQPVFPNDKEEKKEDRPYAVLLANPKVVPVAEPKHNYQIYGLDCEMCYTRAGLELTKVTLVDVNDNVIYDTFVQPANKIIDYNTRFSGITAKRLVEGPTKSLFKVKNDLLQYIDPNTILVGHGLRADLLALRLFHFRVVDTSFVFPHHNSKPFKYSLRHLASTILNKNIQNEEVGHDSIEDAKTAMDLVLMKLCLENTEWKKKKVEQVKRRQRVEP